MLPCSARSGPRDIAEGSVDSATSKKMELKLTGVAKGSQEELKLDYQSYLRQYSLPEWPPEHPALKRFRAKRCATLEEFRLWVADEVKREEGVARTDTDDHGQTRTGKASEPGGPPASVPVRVRPCKSVSSSPAVSSASLPPTLAANGTLSLLNLCIHLLGHQLAAQATAFEREGGFTERLHRVRSAARRNGPGRA